MKSKPYTIWQAIEDAQAELRKPTLGEATHQEVAKEIVEGINYGCNCGHCDYPRDKKD